MRNFYSLAEQKLPKSQKTKEWHIEQVKNFVAFDVRRPDDERRRQQMLCYKYYLCIIDQEKEAQNKPITHPYQHSLGMEWISYPLIESKLEQMVGEYLTRYIQKHVYVLNKDAQTKKLDDMYTLICEEVMREVNKELEPELGFVPETENPEKELPDDVEDFIENSNFKTESEEIANVILDMILIAKKQKDKIKDLLLEFLITDDCIALIEEEDGHPAIKKLNIFETDMDFDPNKEVQDRPQYLVTNKWMPLTKLLNSYDLKPQEERCIKNYMGINGETRMATIGDGFDGTDTYGNWLRGEKNELQVRCVEMKFMSKKKVMAKVVTNKHTGKKIYKLLPDDYDVRKKDDVEVTWIDEPRHIVMCGPDVVLEWGEDAERYCRIDDPKTAYFNIVAIRRNNFLNTNKVRSAAAKLVQLQDFASEVLFELRLAMRRNNGRVLVYDAAQVPKQFLKNGNYSNAINRVMHHAKKDQFLIINSQDKQSRYAFNQFTSLDLSTRGLMQDLFNMLAMVETLASKFLGLTEQREGQIEQYETTGGVERSVAQSNARTEIYMKPFDSFLQLILERLLMKAKYVYKENETVQYFLGDMKTKFLKIMTPFFDDDFGVFIGDNYKESKRKAAIDRAAEQALSQAQTVDLILTLTEVLNAEHSTESEKILKRGMAAMEKLRQENMKAEQENAKTIADATDRKTAEEGKLKREGYRSAEKIATIYANNKAITESLKNEHQERVNFNNIQKDLELADKKTAKS